MSMILTSNYTVCTKCTFSINTLHLLFLQQIFDARQLDTAQQKTK